MKTSLRAMALASLLLASAAVPALAQPETAGRAFEATTLNLTAYGETRLAPDEATITLGVQTRAPTAAEAMAQNAAAMTAVMAALRKAGLPPRAIQTSNLSLNAEYTYPQDKPQVLSGYAAGNTVTVTVEDLAKLGAVIDAVSAAGANQIQGIGFGLRDPSAAEDAARLAAVKALNAKAALYAGATGYHVARLVNLSENGGYVPGPVRPMMMMAKAADATPVAAGELAVRVDVNGVFELAK
jgi:hypothetical protein